MPHFAYKSSDLVAVDVQPVSTGVHDERPNALLQSTERIGSQGVNQLLSELWALRKDIGIVSQWVIVTMGTVGHRSGPNQ